MQGRIIAIRVSGSDFATLDGLKKKESIGLNQLLFMPVEAAYSVTLRTARKPEKETTAKTEKPAKGKQAETGLSRPEVT